MKSPLRKLKCFAKKDHRHHRSPAKLDELVQATQDMVDMRSCYDSLLSAAAATANSAYEFSEALEEMGTCFLEKTALNEDEDSGRVLLMLGKVQFELQKFVDSYRAHIIQTITTPSESLLKELQTVEEMKQQCDEKRDLYKQMLSARKEKGRSKHAKGESVSSQQLQEAQEDYQVEADLFIFRLKSLKQGQSRSLLTQSARHHAAQLNFFRKGLKSLEAVESHVKVVADRERIDYQFSGLEDDDSEDDCDYYSYDDNDDGELSFDYGQNDNDDAFSSSTNSMELDPVGQSVNRASVSESTKENAERRPAESFHFNRRTSAGSQSAPIFPDMRFDPAEKVKVLRPSLTKKFPTYVLPTPLDARRTVSTGRVSPVSTPGLDHKVGAPTQLSHSSPLEPYKFPKTSSDDALSSPKKFPKAQTSVLDESNINSGPIRMLPPFNEELSIPHFNPHRGSDPKKIKRLAFSGPISSMHWSNKPNFSATDFTHAVEHPRASSVMPARVLTSRSSISPKASPNISPPPMKSPKICELHELPRPPIGGLQRSTRPTSLIGHSAPLVYRGPELNKTSNTLPISSQTASPLPTPPAAVQRSFSIPSRRMPMSPVAKFMEDPNNTELSEDFASPPLTPITLTNTRPVSQALEHVTDATRAKGFL